MLAITTLQVVWLWLYLWACLIFFFLTPCGQKSIKIFLKTAKPTTQAEKLKIKINTRCKWWQEHSWQQIQRKRVLQENKVVFFFQDLSSWLTPSWAHTPVTSTVWSVQLSPGTLSTAWDSSSLWGVSGTQKLSRSVVVFGSTVNPVLWFIWLTHQPELTLATAGFNQTDSALTVYLQQQQSSSQEKIWTQGEKSRGIWIATDVTFQTSQPAKVSGEEVEVSVRITMENQKRCEKRHRAWKK